MSKKHRWGVIIDAGSSGSRLHVYRWKDPSRAIENADKEQLTRLPKLKTKWTKKIRPGISTFGDKPTTVGADHLQALIDYALEVVPADQLFDTPIFLMATAGMRLLPESQQNAVLRETCSYLRQNTEFALPDCDQNVQIISGETEGLFGWLAANYLLGGFDYPEDHQHGKNHNTYGFLDMGGASAQIAFAPNATEAAEHADQLKLVRLRTLDGKPSEHRVFTATWLGFGVNQARETYIQELTGRYKDVLAIGGDIPDPCMPKGLRTSLDGTLIEGSAGKANSAREEELALALAQATRAGEAALLGTGEFATCLLNTKPILAKDRSCGGESQPCLIHDSVPSIDFDINHFIGVSEYYHSTHGFFGEEKGDIAYDFNTYQRKVQDFCTQDWTSIRESIMNGGDSTESRNSKAEKADRAIQDAEQACFKASWVINVLHEGIGIPRVGLEPLPPLNMSSDASEESKSNGYTVPFRPVDKIDGTEVSWTLGRMLLYSAGQIPPYGANSSPTGLEGKGMAVGFGSNVKDGSIPADFTYAGSTWEPFSGGSNAHGDNDDWGDAAEDLLGTAREKSAAPGAFILLLLIIVFAWLLRKRDRRTRFFHKAGNLVRRTGLFGSPRRQGRFSASIGTGSSAGNGNGGGSLAGLAKRLFRRNSHEYERVLEEGNLSQFELADMDDNDEFISDSSEGSASAGFRLTSTAGGARTSGLSTPTGIVDRLGDLRPSASVTNFASFSAIDRSGLVVRTESRERLGGNAGRRSRAASPTRLKSAMTPMQSE